MLSTKTGGAALLAGKNAVVYGAGGAVGSAIAHAFAREGARLFLTGRTLATVEPVTRAIVAAGGAAEAAQVDALDEEAVEHHLDQVADTAGTIDISFNAIGIPQVGIQGIPLVELAVESFCLPLARYGRAHFLTARAAARRMAPRKAGVILMHTPEPARSGAPLVGGMGAAWAAMEGLCRCLSMELASLGVRVVCLRTTGLPETKTIEVVFALHAKACGITREQFQSMREGTTHRRRSTSLAELADAAVFAASGRAAALTGTVVNLTGGAVVD